MVRTVDDGYKRELGHEYELAVGLQQQRRRRLFVLKAEIAAFPVSYIALMYLK